MAVGVRPDTALADALGLDAMRGIETDAKGETSIKDIYAAGDCVKSYDITTDQKRVLALLPNAAMQGMVCGTAMAGGNPEPLNSLPMNAI